MKDFLNNIFLKTLIIKNKKIIKLLKIFNFVSETICIIGITIMYIYYKLFISFDLLKASIIIIRTGLFAEVFSIMSAFVINKYKEDYNT